MRAVIKRRFQNHLYVLELESIMSMPCLALQ